MTHSKYIRFINREIPDIDNLKIAIFLVDVGMRDFTGEYIFQSDDCRSAPDLAVYIRLTMCEYVRNNKALIEFKLL